MHKNLYEGRNWDITESHSWTQWLREMCGGLGVDISDAQFSGMIILSMSMPSWDPVIGTLGGILDPKVVISWLNMEWSQRQGLTLKKKRLQCHISGQWEINSKMRKLQQNLVTPKPDVGTKGGVRRSISQVVERQMRCTHLQYCKDSHRHSNSLDLWIHWWMDVWFADSAGNHAHQSKSRGLYTYYAYTKGPRHQCFQKQHGKWLGEGDIVTGIEF